MNRFGIIGVAVVAVAVGYFLGARSPDEKVEAPSNLPPIQFPAAENDDTSVPTPKTDNQLEPSSQGVAGGATNSHFTHFRVGNRNVKAILPDGEIMWVGTSGGVIRYDMRTDQYKRYDTRSGLLANGVFHLSKLKNRLLVGTYGGGMSLLKEDDSGWDTYNIPEGLADAFVYDVLEMDNGDIWIATWSGANRVIGGELDNPEKWETYTVENTGGGLPNDWVYALEKGVSGEVWMATEGGLARYEDGQWENWQHEDGLGAPYEKVRDQIAFKNDPANYSKHHSRQKSEMGLEEVDVAYNPNYIISLVVDKDGSVWAGTWGGGLAHFKNGRWQNYSMDSGLPANHIFMLHQDKTGELWVGTSNGLALRTESGFKRFTTKDGLFSNTVFSMAVDQDRRRWIGSFGGVSRIDKLL